jgi:hypothetical protein
VRLSAEVHVVHDLTDGDGDDQRGQNSAEQTFTDVPGQPAKAESLAMGLRLVLEMIHVSPFSVLLIPIDEIVNNSTKQSFFQDKKHKKRPPWLRLAHDKNNPCHFPHLSLSFDLLLKL